MSKVIAITNEKGGVGKTTTSVNLGIGLARKGKKVLVADIDPQGSLTTHLGFREAEKLTLTTATIMDKIIEDKPLNASEAILTHSEGISILPANIELSKIDMALVTAMSGETILKQYIETIRHEYDYIILDCSPSLGMLTINALSAADSVIIPVAPKYLDVKGLELLLKTIAKINRQINKTLTIEGILVTMADTRTKYNRGIITLIESTYKGKIKIYRKNIPQSVKVSEASAAGISVFTYDPQGKATLAYEALTKEVLGHG